MAEFKSVYTTGANNGLILGAYLSVMFLAQAFGLSWLPALLVGDIMMLAVPFVAYYLLVRDYDHAGIMRHFSAVWLDGIVTFICGSMIMALVVYLYLRFINPTFIVTQLRNVAELYREIGTPEATQLARAFDGIVDSHQVPSPIACAFAMLWTASFSGSILSMLIAAVIRYITRKTPRN